jgi:FG-GAP repeat protein
MTTNNVVSDQHSAVIQNQTTGQVDFLRFNGSQLQSSLLKDYGIGPLWHIVANGDFNGDGNPDLVTQNQITGQLDFLYLDGTANLTSSELSNVVPHVVGAGEFGIRAAGQSGPELVSQLPNGQIDLLAFNATGSLIASDLIPGTVGLPKAVGVGESFSFFPVFSGLGTTDTIVTQLADGRIDFLGFSGDFSTASVSFTNSRLLGVAGVTQPVFAVDQDNDFAHQRDANIASTVDAVARESFDAVIVNSTTGQVDIDTWASGYGDVAHTATFLGSVGTNLFLSAGWQVVDAGIVDHVSVLPLA